METLFVSSTFQDMQSERDAIRDIVLPRLNAEARNYGRSTAICDLRWGINTQELDDELANRRVLDICLSEIDRSAAPMIVILGERYGWIPPSELIQSVASEKKLRLEDMRLSVTALEIAYGMCVHPDNMLFYFRELKGELPDQGYLPEDQEHQQKMAQLKEKIRQAAGDRVHTYQIRVDGGEIFQEDIQHFSDMVFSDIWKIVGHRWSRVEQRSPEELELDRHWTGIREKSGLFLARRSHAIDIAQKVVDGTRSIAIKGSPGSGKSTLLSKVACILSEYNMKIIPVICGMTEETSTAMGVLRYIVRCLELELNLPHAAEPEAAKLSFWRTRLDELCSLFERQDWELVIAVDAVDQLNPDEDRDNLIFLPSGGTARTIISCLPHVICRGALVVPIQPMEAGDKARVIRRMLREYHRELPENVIGALLAKGASDTPLYLSLMLQRLMMMGQEDFRKIQQQGGGMEEISRYQIDLIRQMTDSLEAMSAELIQTVGEKAGLTRRVNEYIALSRYGLREGDLALLLGDDWNYLAFRHMFHYMRESYIRREDGRYDFAHQSIRRGILRVCGNQPEKHSEILTALRKQGLNDSLFASESIYQCMMMADSSETEVVGKKLFLAIVAGFQTGTYKNTVGLKDAANSVHTICLADGGQWMSDLFEHSEQYDHNGEKKLILGGKSMLEWLVRFFDNYCCKLFAENDTECRILLRILTQECGLYDQLVAAGCNDLEKSRMWCCQKCANAAKKTRDSSRAQWVEKYLFAGKKLYQEGTLSDREIWDVYYNAVILLEDVPDKKDLRRGVAIAEEALDGGLLDRLRERNVDLGISLNFFHGLGRTYSDLREYEKSLNAYQQNLKLQQARAEEKPLPENLFALGFAYYDVGIAAQYLDRLEDACSYYEKGTELIEKNVDEQEKFESGLLFLSNSYVRYNRYADALFDLGTGSYQPDSIPADWAEKAFSYKKNAIQFYKRHHRENHTFPKDFPPLAQKLGSMSAHLIDKNPGNREHFLLEMCAVFDELLTKDESQLLLEASKENRNALENDYQGIFQALKNIPDVESVQEGYRNRYRGSLLQYFDNRIREVRESAGPEGEYALAKEYYNKSLGLFRLGENAFSREALESAETASQLLAKAEQSGNGDPAVLYRLEAEVFYHTAQCQQPMKDVEKAFACLRSAIDAQTKLVGLTGDSTDSARLKRYKDAYEKATAEKAEREEQARRAAATKPPEKKVYQNANGTYTVEYPDGSCYVGELLDGERHGTGTLIRANSRASYRGQWKNGLRDGYGEETFPSGASYRGEWKADKIRGHGIRTNIHGDKTCGLWDGSTLIREMSAGKVNRALRKYQS